MGLIRKTMSVCTVGLVSYRTDGERQARFARQTRNAVRAQVAQGGVGLHLQRDRLAQATSHHVDDVAAGGPPRYAGVPAGWYDDGAGHVRWWDGGRWTPHTR